MYTNPNFSRFRHYYCHILLLKWLKPSAPNGATGLLLASTFGLQVAAHLAYKDETETVDARSTVTQISSLTSSTKSNRRRISTLPQPDIITLEEEPSKPELDRKFNLTENHVPISLSRPLSLQISSPSAPSEVRKSIYQTMPHCTRKY